MLTLAEGCVSKFKPVLKGTVVGLNHLPVLGPSCGYLGVLALYG